MNLFKNVRRAIHATCYAPVLCLALSGAVSAVWADFTTGFETSSGGYTSGSSIVGVYDSGITSSWSSFGGSSPTVTSTPGQVQSGSQALLFNLTNTVSQGIKLNLANAVNVTQPFTLQFGLNILNSTATASSPINFQLGASNYSNTDPSWIKGYIGNGSNPSIYLYQAATPGSTSMNSTKIGNYLTFGNLGTYLTLSITVDPSMHKYTNVTISGDLASQDVTDAVLAGSGGGEIPWLNGTGSLGAVLTLVSGSYSTGSLVAIDNIAIVPEADSGSLLLMGMGLFCAMAMCRRVRAAV